MPPLLDCESLFGSFAYPSLSSPTRDMWAAFWHSTQTCCCWACKYCRHCSCLPHQPVAALISMPSALACHRMVIAVSAFLLQIPPMPLFGYYALNFSLPLPLLDCNSHIHSPAFNFGLQPLPENGDRPLSTQFGHAADKITATVTCPPFQQSRQ